MAHLCQTEKAEFCETIGGPGPNISSEKGGEAVEEEQKWIRDIQRRGSRQAADQLVRAYYDEIYRFAVRQTGHKEDAMDLTQTIFSSGAPVPAGL